MAQDNKIFERPQIESIMPHQEPFLFIDRAEICGDSITGTYTIRPDEPILKGHFKGNPVFPGTIMLETIGQLAVLYLIASDNPELKAKVDQSKIFFTSADGARCMKFCRPGDVLTLSAKVLRLRHPLAMFEGSLLVNGQKGAFVEKICLTFEYKK